MTKRKFFIDTDTATDDAVALVMALRNSDIDVLGISTVAGNCTIEQATQNALYTQNLVGSTVPVHVGAAGPLMRDLQSAHNVHGQDGMGDIGLELHSREPASYRGVQALIDAIMDNPGEIELVTLGPLTNLALALRLEPGIIESVKRVVSMGGTAVLPGNVTALAEFNFWADPEAAYIVANSGLQLEMAGWDISTSYAVIHDELAAELRSVGMLGAFAMDIQAVLREFCRNETMLDGFDLPDPLAMAIAIEPTIVTREAHHFVDVISGDGPARGQTIVEERGNSGREPNCRVIYEVDRERFLELLHASLTDSS